MNAFWSRGFRPFFLGSAAFATLAMALWALTFAGWSFPFDGAITLQWHSHEMIFGYTGGVIAGFALTAVPNWTRRLPVAGMPLAMLFGLWVLGRGAMLAAPAIGAGTAAVLEGAFLPVLAAYLLREILAAGNLRNLPIAGMVTAIALSNIYWHLSDLSGWDVSLAQRCGLALVSMLIALVGGRITPSFTHNWLNRIGRSARMPAVTLIDKAALGVCAVALASWVVAPESRFAGAVLMLAGVALAVRMSRWRGWQTVSEPLVLVLHVGYLWLAVSFGLLGAAAFVPGTVDPLKAMHALTAGAIGTVTLAVMTRASLGHTGAELRADIATVLIYLLVTAGAIARLLASPDSQSYLTQIAAGGLLWGGAFAVFVVSYGPRLFTSGPPVASGPASDTNEAR